MKKQLGLALMGLVWAATAQASTLECWVEYCPNNECEGEQARATSPIWGEENATIRYTIGSETLYSVSLSKGFMQMRMRHPKDGFYATASLDRFEKHSMLTLENSTGAEYELHCVKK